MGGGSSVADRFSILGVGVSAADGPAVVHRIIRAARERRSLGVSALAVHGIMLAVFDRKLRTRINRLDIVTADGQPVRWALNILHRVGLRERVYGPDLMRDVCACASDEGLSVFLFGNTSETLTMLVRRLGEQWPTLEVAGVQPSRFRAASPGEAAEDRRRIVDSGADIVLVGLGCPRQEVWVYENKRSLGVPVVAVGAAFDYHSGRLCEPPRWMMLAGLQWLHRLLREPGRLWRRYLLLNPVYLALVALQLLRPRWFAVEESGGPLEPIRPG